VCIAVCRSCDRSVGQVGCLPCSALPRVLRISPWQLCQSEYGIPYMATCCPQSGTLLSVSAFILLVEWQEGHSTCKNSATTIPKSLSLGTGQTGSNLIWNKSRKMGRLYKSRVCVESMKGRIFADGEVICTANSWLEDQETILLQRNPSFGETLDQVHFSWRLCWKVTTWCAYLTVKCVRLRTFSNKILQLLNVPHMCVFMILMLDANTIG